MIFHNYKTIFIHIPKAGGTSIENLLWPDISTRTHSDLWMGFILPHFNKYQTGGLQHLLAKQVKEEVGSLFFDTYYKFTIVRNPWIKAVSQYVYILGREDLKKFIHMKSDASFLEYLSLIIKIEHVQWKSQIDFIIDNNGDQLVDDYFKLEEIEQNYEKLSSKIGINFHKLSHANKGNYSSYKDFYTKESIEMVSEIYKKDINYFRYEYN